jgi:hypothetical protein
VPDHPVEADIGAGAGGPSPSNGPTTEIDTAEIAERVYRLMRHDLLVERDRTQTSGV